MRSAMRNDRKITYRLLAVIVSVFLVVGCGDKKESSSDPAATDSAKQQAVSEAAIEEYNYDEFVNDVQVDLTELEEEELTDPEARAIYDVDEQVNQVIKTFEKKYTKKTKITPDNSYDYLYELRNYLWEQEIENVSYIDLDGNRLEIYYNVDHSGVFMYTPPMDGYSAGTGSKKLNIATYEPFYTEISKKEKKAAKNVDQAAENIDTEFDMYQFDDRNTQDDRNYDDEEVTFENILNMGQNSIVLWNGHGSDFGEDGCVLATSIPVTKQNLKKYGKDIEEKRLIRGSEEGVVYYCMTPAFFDYYLPDNALKNCIIYLGACDTGKNSSLIDVLISKGAAAIFSNSGTIETSYNLAMIKSVAQGMIKKKGGKYYTLDQALEYAQGVNGETDSLGTYAYLTYGQGYSDLSLDWYQDYKTAQRDIVLVLDRSGSMDGTPLDETKMAANEFVDTVLQKDCRIGIVAYDSEAICTCSLSRNESVLHSRINDIEVGYDTNMYDGISLADEMLQKSNAAKKFIVLMTDGCPNAGTTVNGSFYDALTGYSTELKDQNYYLYTLGFFSQLDYNERIEAQSLLETMATPGYHYEVESAQDLRFFFDDMANQIDGTKYVYIRIACPVDVKVKYNGETLSSDVENQNNRTSFGTLTYEDSEEVDDPVKVLRLKMGQDYDIDISGYDRGTMDYTVSYPDDSGNYGDVREFPDIDVTSKTKITSNTEQSDASYLKVDEDGDGKYEKTYKAESNGDMEEVKDHTLLYILLGVAAALIFFIIILIIVLVKRRNKKKTQIEIPHTVLRKDNPSVQGQVKGLFGSFMGRSYPVSSGMSYRIGRESSCDIQIVHKRVSRVHCTIELMPDGIYQVTDYSSNGTFYNNTKLQYGILYTIPRGSILAIGDADNVIQLM